MTHTVSYMHHVVHHTPAGFPRDSAVKNPPADAGDVGLTPGSGDPLERGMATHFSVLAWGIPWTEEFDGLQSMGLQRVGHG